MPDVSLRTSTSIAIFAIALVAGCAAGDETSVSEPAPDRAGVVAPGHSHPPHASFGVRGQGDRHHPPARSHHGQLERPAPAPSPGPSPSIDPFADAFVRAHNVHRARVSPAARTPLPRVSWSPEVAAHAQAWAERCEFEHSGGDFGENLAARTGAASPEDILASWASEADDFNYGNTRCASGKVCGHYTQIVWRDSTQIGCGVAQCGGGGPFGGRAWTSWVCNYSPAGNWMGERPY